MKTCWFPNKKSNIDSVVFQRITLLRGKGWEIRPDNRV